MPMASADNKSQQLDQYLILSGCQNHPLLVAKCGKSPPTPEEIIQLDFFRFSFYLKNSVLNQQHGVCVTFMDKPFSW